MRKILTVAFVFLIYLLLTRPAHAQSQFKTYLSTEYLVNEKGALRVSQNVTLENLYSDVYASSFSVSLEGIDPVNPKAMQDGRNLNVVKTTDLEKVTLKVDFDDAVVGKGKRRVFTISFDDNSIVTKTGEVWEVLIPKLNSASGYESYSVTLDIPKGFGELAYMSPEPSSKSVNDGLNVYYFGNSSGARNGISAAFGQFQVFDFSLTYHLENPLARISTVEIAIPPDTAYQKLNYRSIEPRPTDVRVDPDGNWLAKYNLAPRQRLDVKAEGAVQIFASPREFPVSSTDALNQSLGGSDFWQTTDPQIVSLAKKLRTPKEIYNYVSTVLSYDYNRVQPNVQRLGAIKALENPKSAICTEFTDLFVAIARAAGIPAREINGYAYTENPQIQPLSLVADVLHAWPEYWDSKSKVWIPVDPTWGSTTKGINFFDNLDLRHFAFVIHGADAQKPYPAGSYKLGANPQKDVFVSFGKLPEKRASIPEIKTKTSGGILFLGLKVDAQIDNPGPVGLYNERVKVYFDQKLNKDFKIPELPVFGKYDFAISVPYGFFGQGTPEKVTIIVGTQITEVPTHKLNFVIANVSIVLVVIFGLTFLTYLRIRKLIARKRRK